VALFVYGHSALAVIQYPANLVWTINLLIDNQLPDYHHERRSGQWLGSGLFVLFRTLTLLVVWHSGSALVSINEVTLCRSQLVLEWVTICRRVNHLGLTGNSGQLSLLRSVGRKMSTGQSDSLPLGSKGRYGSFHLWINVHDR